MSIFGSVTESKTKPKQTQTKPNCEMTKMNVSSMISDDYGKNPPFCQNRNKPKTNPKQSQSGVVFDYAGTSPKPISG